MQQCQVRDFPQILFQALIQMNGAWKMVYTVGVWSLGHDSSALTTRSWLLAKFCYFLYTCVVDKCLKRAPSNLSTKNKVFVKLLSLFSWYFKLCQHDLLTTCNVLTILHETYLINGFQIENKNFWKQRLN
jgi:hypothetical protein